MTSVGVIGHLLVDFVGVKLVEEVFGPGGSSICGVAGVGAS